MRLADLVADLDHLDDDSTIFVVDDGPLSADAECIALALLQPVQTSLEVRKLLELI